MAFFRVRKDVRPKEVIEVSTVEQMLLLDILKEERKRTREQHLMWRAIREHLGIEDPKGGVPSGGLTGKPLAEDTGQTPPSGSKDESSGVD